MLDDISLPDSDDPGDWIGWTARQQAIASDPERSAWVSANAGSGKTHVLTQRVIRLLLAGARPSGILCLTYTKAAASEMSNRVFQRLAEWTNLPDEELATRITAIEGQPPNRAKMALARQLFARALETPGGLKIQTIHAFCEALLHQFPLEANVAGHFSVLDDRAAALLLADARRSLLTATTMEDDAELAEAFALVLELGDEAGLDALLSEIIHHRNAISRFSIFAETQGGIDLVLRSRLSLASSDTEESIAADYWPLPGLRGAKLEQYLLLADRKGGAKAHDIAYGLRLAHQETDVFKRADLLENLFLRKTDGEPKADKEFFVKAMLDDSGDLGEAVTAARSHIVAHRDRLKRMRMFRATYAALVLARHLNQDYEELKKRHSQLDFEDLITRTAELLTKSNVGPWVHYKLDQGIDHLLVDEAQDTSPIQWSVIQSLTEDFFAGAGARNQKRTIFAVGDEKQSIYSFQGARPERFSLESDATRRRVLASGQDFSAVRLPLSFRSTSDVLAAVDHVFSQPERAQGLSALHDPIVHRSSRLGHPGAVDLWEMIAPEETEKPDDWTAPFDATPENAPSAILARRIAQTISTLVKQDYIVEHGRKRLIEPGDILVLVRKRDAFVTALTRALKNRSDIPVAGADRLVLTRHIAVQDLMALGRFLLLPQDDLSLAATLKSPLFDFTEDEIFEITAQRGEQESAWAHFKALAETHEKFALTCRKLLDFIDQSRVMPVYDFYARVLGSCGGRRQFLARLGSEVSDILDEFLTFTLEHEQLGVPGLQSFIAILESEAPEVKREQDKGRNEVRIMTVHASKGLEAPVVFLVDSGAKAFTHTHLPKLRMIEGPGETPPMPVWVPVSDLANSITKADADTIERMAEEEYHRLLYVGMTRAADRLVICGYRGLRHHSHTWHNMVAAAMNESHGYGVPAQFGNSEDQWQGIRWQLPHHDRAFDLLPTLQTQDQQAPVPDYLHKPLPPQKQLPRPLSPSGTGTMIDDEAGNLLVTSPLFSEKAVSDRSLERGRLIHRMLQILPDFMPPDRGPAAQRYVDRAARFWPQKDRERIVAMVMNLLNHPALQGVFSAHAQAEVSIMGTLVLGQKEFAVSGRIDRLAALEDRIVILDYKTNRVPPSSLDAIPFAHRAQLAMYRQILVPLYPGKPIECLLVYSENASLFTLPDPVMSQALAQLQTK